MLTFNCSQPTSLSLSLFPSLCSSPSLGQRDLYVYALPWQLSIFSESQLPSFYFIHPHTTSTASVRARLRDPGIVGRFRPGLHAARESFDWRMANAGRNCFRQKTPKRYFPVSNVTIARCRPSTFPFRVRVPIFFPSSSFSFFSSSTHRSFQKFSIELTKYRQISSSVRRGKGVSSRG